MGYTLYMGDQSYSSWSLRGWLLLHRFGLPYTVRLVDFASSGVAAQMAGVAPARTVPTLVTAEGTVIWDSLAMAEELASRHPEAGIWPSDPARRALARSLAAEMHSGFAALRSTCPMNLRAAYTGVEPGEAVRADLDRIEEIWAFARRHASEEGPWLLGGYSAADAFFAPVAGRIAGYGLTVGAEAMAYVDAHLQDPAFRRWRAMGLVRGADLPWYARDFAQRAWPGPLPAPARAVETGPSVNEACPYSGKPVTQYLELEGQVWGFCNAFCRDKTVADPDAWPAFRAMTDRARQAQE